jgi:predicted secreted protein
MTTGAIKAHGTLLKRAGTTIAEVRTISGPSLSVDVDDVTSHDSTDGWEETIATILRSGEVTFDINYVPTAATHKNTSGGLLYDFANRSVQTWTLVFPDTGATTWTFSAFVTKFQPIADPKSALRASVSLKITGKPTLV